VICCRDSPQLQHQRLTLPAATCAADAGKQLHWLQLLGDPAESLPTRVGVTTSSHTTPLVQEEAPLQNKQKFGKNKNMFMGSDGARYQEWLCPGGGECFSSWSLSWNKLRARMMRWLLLGHRVQIFCVWCSDTETNGTALTRIVVFFICYINVSNQCDVSLEV
jgi:hypothetical protein